MRVKKIKMCKAVFFQNLSFFWFFFIKFYILRGYDVFVFNFNLHLISKKWIKKLIANKKLIRIYIEPATIEDGTAIDETEKIYENLIQNPIVKCINRFSKKKSDTFIKKMLVSEIIEYFYINAYFEKIKKNCKYKKVIFVPTNYIETKKLIYKYGSAIKENPERKVTIPLYIYIFSCINYRIDFTIYYLGAFFYSILKFCQIIYSLKFKTYRLKEKRYKYAFPLDFPHQILKFGDRGFDMLLDNNKINSKNTIFLVSCKLNRKQNQYIQKNSYTCFDISKHGRRIDLKMKNDFYQITKNIKKNIIPLLISFAGHIILFKTYLFCIKHLIIWNHIWSNCRFDNYIYSNKEGATQNLINNFLNEKKCTTWNFPPFIGGGYSSSITKDFNHCRHILWSFLNSNYFLGISEYQIQYHKLHKQEVEHYENIGHLYSEIVKDKTASIDSLSFLKKNFKPCVLPSEAKIITIFDTTFVDFENAPTTYDDGINFYEDVFKLLHSNDSFYFIIKPSKNENWFVNSNSVFSSVIKGQKIVKLINKIKNENRVLWFSKSDSILSFEFNSLAIAVSDLVITHCMSSPTVESLGARKKAIWYEHGNKREGIHYDQIDGLVIHGYANLEKRVNEILYTIPDEDYEDYLDTKIKGKVEARLDGKALTRFRNLL
jgi:polysaccharide biosynthesis PFTS motif protein